MFQPAPAADAFASKPELYAELALQLTGLFTGERDRIANAANMSALIFEMLPDLNWAGFYFLNAAGDELVVGPFQGKPACVRIAIGRGVCGTSVAEKRSIVVPDVFAFPGHIDTLGVKLTVKDAIKASGGLSIDADRASIRLVRPSPSGGEHVLAVDLGIPATNHVLKPGDLLIVYHGPSQGN